MLKVLKYIAIITFIDAWGQGRGGIIVMEGNSRTASVGRASFGMSLIWGMMGSQPGGAGLD